MVLFFIHLESGVWSENLHKFIIRKWMFGYLLKISIICGALSFLYNPTGDGNNTKISRFGFQKAADSIAHACLVN